MNNGDFYIAAASVIPLLLIGLMAARVLRLGEMSGRLEGKILVLGLGLAVIGEIAVFSFLFFEPVPTAAAVILAVATWAALLGELSLATWWLVGLLKPDPQAKRKSHVEVSVPPVVADPPDVPVSSAETNGRHMAGGTPTRAQGGRRRATTGRPSRTRSNTTSSNRVDGGGVVMTPREPPGELDSDILEYGFCPLCGERLREGACSHHGVV
jgi:hypothetical protein